MDEIEHALAVLSSGMNAYNYERFRMAMDYLAYLILAERSAYQQKKSEGERL